MHGMSIEEERALLEELRRREREEDDLLMGQIVRGDEEPDHTGDPAGHPALECPCCHGGKIVTTCDVERGEDGIRSWWHRHRCDRCGEVFETVALQADVWLRSPHEVLRSLETPLGRFHALVGGAEVPFRHRTFDEDLGEGYGRTQVHQIAVDVSGLSVGDVVSCVFEGAELSFTWSGERAIHSCGLGGGYAGGVTAYDPEIRSCYKGTEHGRELEETYPYDILSATARGFDYAIERDPSAYDASQFWPSGFIELRAAWVPKPYESFSFDDDEGVRLDDLLICCL